MRRILVMAAAIMFCFACSESPIKPKPDAIAAVDSSVVTPGLLSSLDAQGRFQLSIAGGTGEITVETAERLARIWIRDFAAFTMKSFELERGAAIPVQSLNVCGRTFYANSPFETPAEASIKKLFGPHWLVTVCSGAAPAISLAISALNTDLTIRNDSIVWPAIHGADWFPVGIPVSTLDVPMSPEAAATTANQLTGLRVERAPELILAGPPYAPQVARWRIHLESEATVRSVIGSRTTQVAELFVGRSVRSNQVRLFIASDSQPTERSISTPSNEPAQRGLQETHRVARKSGIPVALTAVHAVPRS